MFYRSLSMLLVGSLVDLFNSCRLHISYKKYVKLFLKDFDQGNSLSPFGW